MGFWTLGSNTPSLFLLQVKKWQLREVDSHVQGHTARTQGTLGNAPFPRLCARRPLQGLENIDFSKCQAKSKVEIHISPTARGDPCTAPSPLS